MSELAQRSTTARLGPGGPPSLRKHCQTGLSDVGAKKASLGRKRAKAVTLTRVLVATFLKPRKALHGAHGATRNALAGCLQRQKQPHGARLAAQPA